MQQQQSCGRSWLLPSSVNQDRIICGLFEQIISNNPQIISALFAMIWRLFVVYLRLFVGLFVRLFVKLFVVYLRQAPLGQQPGPDLDYFLVICRLFQLICRLFGGYLRLFADYLQDYFRVI